MGEPFFIDVTGKQEPQPPRISWEDADFVTAMRAQREWDHIGAKATARDKGRGRVFRKSKGAPHGAQLFPRKLRFCLNEIQS